MTRRIALSGVMVFALAALLGGCTSLGISPRPTTALIRLGFDMGGESMSKKLEKHVPAGVVSVLDEHYDAGDEDARLDVFYPSPPDGQGVPLPTIVWVHGGAWVSGSRSQVANYLRVLAGKGYTVVGVDYSIAPRKVYPAPLLQVNAALAYLQAHAERLRVDPARFYLAGDSAGAQIAAQVANIVSEPSYAQLVGVEPSIGRAQLRGVLLYCGAYDIGLIDLKGASGVFLKTVLWSYSGSRDFMSDPRFAPASVVNFVTQDFPPTFISVGNADPLRQQSFSMAERLESKRVPVEALFFAEDHQPTLPHEYQFDLDGEAGQQALARSVQFLSQRR